ncbi:YbaB/EbfC family nucleoid-associated protein [Amycolatopsis cihanbeyliensis]|uniref:YbaB/EbfC DNA-binding family protein n=1 Tax=Amycolatopsis cihanbeyliensis TaxID=1128664 RepID=A0A542DP64_AMYCI|nr:YbaB/EbfC family nucleoid-associated protein [Amycolatopsis cihanbeyliensis]TQJ04764.1 YbaB/EbfC DNA-binding family protein [Amycolatopsis cihanbeyliensis]
MTDHRAQVEELLADYRRSRDHLLTVQRELAAITESVSSRDGLVTATVGARGTLTGLELAAEAYRRYRPTELAEEIVRVTQAATIKALAGAGQVLSPALPRDTDPQALLLGTADLGVLAPDVPVEAEEESFENKSWVDRA